MLQKSYILTPNKRLSRQLENDFLHHQAGVSIPKIIKILPINSWLALAWQNVIDERIVIDQIQEKFIWRQIITLNSNLNLIEQAVSFHSLITAYKIDINKFNVNNDELATFLRWYKKFKNYCHEKKLITISELPANLIDFVEDFKMLELNLIGFDEISPALTDLITALEKTGCKIIKGDPNKTTASQKHRIAFESTREEITTIAKFTQKVLANEPKAKIGIVSPNLKNIKDKIADTFYETFGSNQNINFSLGTNLDQLPIIHLALKLLAIDTFSMAKLSDIITSPYIRGSLKEQSARISLSKQILKNPDITIEGLIDTCAQATSLLKHCLQTWSTLILGDKDQLLTPLAWSKSFIAILKSFWWPGEENLNDLEALGLNQFREIINNFGTNNYLVNKISRKAALQMLQEIVANKVVNQPSTSNHNKIDILGILEGAGINFDYLWIMGLDDQSWPPFSTPNPFIPISIQKTMFLPHSSTKRELDFCRTLLTRYQRSAKKIIFSYSKQNGDQILEPSPLIIDYPELSINDLDLSSTVSLTKNIYLSKKTEKLTDDQGPKLSAAELISTSSRLIELQSTCPFRAFAEFRLHLENLPKETMGVSKIDRGIVLHQALEKFWKKIKTQANLIELTFQTMEQMVIYAISSSLDQLNLTPKLKELELKTLTKLLTRWLELEKNREHFQLLVSEKNCQVKLANLDINLRIDRIDKLAENKNILIDYKSGKELPTIMDWFSMRPKNPQLILYSIAINDIDGLAIAQINSDSVKFKEITLEELTEIYQKNHPGSQINITWKWLISYWKNNLAKLASEFSSGQAQVAPLSREICQRCNFDPICRITN